MIPRSSLSNQLSLRAVLIVPFIVQISAAVGITGYLSWRNGQQAVNQLAGQLRDEVTKRTQQHLTDYLQEPPQINQVNRQAVEAGKLDEDNVQQLQNHFWQQIQLFPRLRELYIGKPNGGYFAISREADQSLIVKEVLGEDDQIGRFYALSENGDRQNLIRETAPYDPRQRPWYQAALESRTGTWSDIYLFRYGALGITASELFLNADGSMGGVMAVDLVLSGMSEFLSTIEVSPSGKIFIIERSGLLVASSSTVPPFLLGAGGKNPQRLMARESSDRLIRETAEFLMQERQLESIEEVKQLNFGQSSDRSFVQVSPYQDNLGLDWLIVVVVPESDFMGQIYANTWRTIQLCSLALLIATGFGWMSAHWISEPIMQLIDGSQKLAKAALSRCNNDTLAQNVQVRGVQEVKILAHSFNQMASQLQESFAALERSNQELELRVEKRTADLRREREKSEELLLNILPEAIAEKLKQETQAIAEYFESVTILFSDIVGFTTLSARLAPIDLVNCLNEMFSSFDHLAEKHGLEKIKTIGDAYMMVGGLPIPQPDHTAAMAAMALDMQKVMQDFTLENGEALQIRIGIHTGPVVAGVIGVRKFSYDLWGDTVNTASRMESSGTAGRIHVSHQVYEVLKDRFQFEERGIISVKGKGEMKTYWLVESYSALCFALGNRE
ncbi:adenylate/guanylate cyclase domain-containing protein [Roseofilum sp. Guam]|uniref:adenylate/guanylate cyclase domain-containing protein n=1 Tax=Roseofilum sp. Guam TaxID=2821502 RepID=UPI001B1C12A4|nr:adenylate/guanylate cyclase domain-containing protein [Roseofilum sp. Guam]MBP0030736.1 adenylate/guanylate cyclase domain-containing protein [Roseofilum sp. Guam]